MTACGVVHRGPLVHGSAVTGRSSEFVRRGNAQAQDGTQMQPRASGERHQGNGSVAMLVMTRQNKGESGLELTFCKKNSSISE